MLIKAYTESDFIISLPKLTPSALVAECIFPPLLSFKVKKILFELERKRHHTHLYFSAHIKNSKHAELNKVPDTFFPGLFNSAVGQERKASACPWCYSGWQQLTWCYYSGTSLVLATHCPKDTGHLQHRWKLRSSNFRFLGETKQKQQNTTSTSKTYHHHHQPTLKTTPKNKSLWRLSVIQRKMRFVFFFFWQAILTFSFKVFNWQLEERHRT